MKLRYVCEKEMLVKEYLEYVGISHHLRKKVRGLDNIYINGEKAKNYYKLNIGDILELEFEEELNSEYSANFADLDKIKIKYEDEYLMVISKDINISSLPSKRHEKDNVLSILKAYFINNNIQSNIHLVNRLDYATSGLMIIAKSNICQHELSKDKITKKYLAYVDGILDVKEGLIDKPIAREEAPSILRYVSKDGQSALTKYKVLKEENGNSLVELELLTGRCHQIRVHMKSVGTPIIGDKLYNNKCSNDVLHLHSYYLSFTHPFTKEIVEIIDYPNWEDVNL